MIETSDRASDLNVRPAIERPVIERPANERSVNVRPAVERPVFERPVFESPVSERATSERATSDRATSERANSERAAERPANERSVNERPVYECPVFERPGLQTSERSRLWRRLPNEIILIILRMRSQLLDDMLLKNDPCTCRGFIRDGRNKLWHALSPCELRAAIVLKYTQTTWDAGWSTDSTQKRWVHLRPIEVRAALDLGYNKTMWDLEYLEELVAYYGELRERRNDVWSLANDVCRFTFPRS